MIVFVIDYKRTYGSFDTTLIPGDFSFIKYWMPK